MSNPAILSAPRLSAHLAGVIDTLCKIIGAHAGRHRAAAPIVMLLWTYLRRVARRFDSLARRLGAGKGGARPARPRTAAASPSAGAPRKPRLPGGFAWVVRLTQEAACSTSQLRHLLVDPDMVALMAVSPQAGRILRPLCRMLGLEPGPDLPPSLFGPPKAARSADPPAAVPDTDAASPAPQSTAGGKPRPPRARDRPPWRYNALA